VGGRNNLLSPITFLGWWGSVMVSLNKNEFITLKIESNLSSIPLYKYNEEQYLRSLCEQGNIRIGTLYDYRHTEEYGDYIGEKAEGIKEAVVKKTIYTTNPEDLSPLLKEHINIKITKKAKSPPKISIGEITIRNKSPNCLVYSISHKLCRDIPKQLEPKYSDKYYVQINSIIDFSFHLTEALKKEGDFQGPQIISCIYRSRSVDHWEEDFVHPVKIKDPKYESQAEVRIIWFHKNPATKLEPVILNCDDLKQFCRLSEFEK
jgi:hypothetical protein